MHNNQSRRSTGRSLQTSSALTSRMSFRSRCQFCEDAVELIRHTCYRLLEVDSANVKFTSWWNDVPICRKPSESFFPSTDGSRVLAYQFDHSYICKRRTRRVDFGVQTLWCADQKVGTAVLCSPCACLGYTTLNGVKHRTMGDRNDYWEPPSRIWKSVFQVNRTLLTLTSTAF